MVIPAAEETRLCMKNSRKQTASFIAALGCGLPNPDGYISPITEAGTHFVFALDTEVCLCAFLNSDISPTAVLHKDGCGINFWALKEPVSAWHPDLLDLVEALGMAGVEEPLPAPGVDDWSLEFLDRRARYSLEELTKAYLTHEH